MRWWTVNVFWALQLWGELNYWRLTNFLGLYLWEDSQQQLNGCDVYLLGLRIVNSDIHLRQLLKGRKWAERHSQMASLTKLRKDRERLRYVREGIPFFSYSAPFLSIKQHSFRLHLFKRNASQPQKAKLFINSFFQLSCLPCWNSMWQKHPIKSSYTDSMEALEADIRHANTLAASLPRDYGGNYIQMKLSYSPFATFFLSLMEWLDFSCTNALPSYLGLLNILVYNKTYVDGMPSLLSKERKATVKEFYAVIYPSLRLLEGEFNERSSCREVLRRKGVREDECGICMENNMKMKMMVLPSCGHSLCINCFNDWNGRSESCPFCRGSLKRVSQTDLWVVVEITDVIERDTLAMENLRRFYHYMETLPFVIPQSPHFSVYSNYML